MEVALQRQEPRCPTTDTQTSFPQLKHEVSYMCY